jgi:hypothetical protein
LQPYNQQKKLGNRFWFGTHRQSVACACKLERNVSMTLHFIKAATSSDFAAHGCVRPKRTQPWTAQILGSRNEAEGDPFERSWIMPSIVWHLPVVNQDYPRYHLQFKETFIQV